MGAVYRLLAEWGRSAQLTESDHAFRAACKLGPEEVPQVQATLAVLRHKGLVPPQPWKLRDLLGVHAPDVQETALALSDAESAYYRGMAAACLNTAPRWSSTLDADILALIEAPRADLPWSIGVEPAPAEITSPAAARPATPHTEAPAPVIPPLAPEADVEDEGTGIVQLAEGLIAVKLAKKEWTPKTASQMRQTAILFTKVTGRERLTQVRQVDAANFADTLLLKFPKSYGKSSRDATMPVADILAAAEKRPESERGLEGATINRHLTHFGNLVAYAKGRGVRPPEPLDLAVLRAKKKGRDRDARPPFTTEQVTTLLQAPVWRGSASEVRRMKPGRTIVHDALYWTTPVAALSLMRREEVCGLMVADVKLDVPIPHFDIRPNGYRRLKNAQSKRRVPIHPELLRLGFDRYVRAVADLGYDLIFPDLLPASGSAALGDQLYDEWAPVLASQLPDAPAGLVFHSLRHFGNDRLTDAEVMLEWRQDILGHGGESEAEERYRSETHLQRMLPAIEKLPTVTQDLKPAEITLRRSVIEKTGRRPRGRQVADIKA